MSVNTGAPSRLFEVTDGGEDCVNFSLVSGVGSLTFDLPEPSMVAYIFITGEVSTTDLEYVFSYLTDANGNENTCEPMNSWSSDPHPNYVSTTCHF